MKKNKGFTLAEMLITVLIIGIIAMLSIAPLMTFVAKTRLSHNAHIAAQIIQEAQNHARTKSKYIYVLFSRSNVKIPYSNLISYDFESKVYYDSSGSTIPSSIVYFDYKGNTLNIGSTTNKIKICYGTSSCSIYKTLTITPVTGLVTIQ